VSVFYEMKVYICGIIFVLDGPRDGVRRGQLGGVIDEGLDDCDFEVFEGSNDGRERQNIRLTTVRACSREAEMTRTRLSRSSDIKVDGSTLPFLKFPPRLISSQQPSQPTGTQCPLFRNDFVIYVYEFIYFIEALLYRVSLPVKIRGNCGI
jgi:hypothetical protein